MIAVTEPENCSSPYAQVIRAYPQPTLLVMPTGSGKTWTARQILAYWAERGYRGVYLAPLKALAQEQFQSLCEDFPNLKIGLCTGETASDPRQAQILVATHEKFDVYLKRPKHHLRWLAQVNLLVVDEVHLLADPERGGRLESLLMRFLEVNPFVQILGLSATLSNAEELTAWFGGQTLVRGRRPVPLETHFLRYKNEVQKEEHLVRLLEEARTIGGQTLIFVATRRRAESLEVQLRDRDFQVRHHHSGLRATERKEVETAFRQGKLEVLVATPTLEMGINLPVRRVILYDAYQFNGEGFSPLSVQSFLQRAGRAGRPGLDPKGEAYLLLPTWSDDTPYRRGVPERVLSRLGRPEVLTQFFLDIVDAGLAQNEAELKAFYRRSLHAHQKAEADLQKNVSLLINEEFLTYKEDGLRVTFLGRVTARLSLSPEALVLSRQVLDLGAKTPYDLILTVALWSNVSPRIWCAWEDLELVQEILDPLASGLLNVTTDAFPVPRRRLLSAVKMLALLSQEGESEVLAERFGVYPVEVERLRTSIPETLMAFSQVLDPLGFPQLETIAEQAAMISKTGLPLEAVPFLTLKGIGPVLSGRLYKAGFTPTNLRNSDPTLVAQVRGISLKKAQGLVLQARQLIPHQFVHQGEREGNRQASWSHPFDPYRLRRSLELKHKAGMNPIRRVVYGGSEERVVLRKGTRYRCSCPDHAKHQGDCKHILYCKRVDGDVGVLAAVADLPQGVSQSLRTGLRTLWQSANRRLPW